MILCNVPSYCDFSKRPKLKKAEIFTKLNLVALKSFRVALEYPLV